MSDNEIGVEYNLETMSSDSKGNPFNITISDVQSSINFTYPAYNELFSPIIRATISSPGQVKVEGLFLVPFDFTGEFIQKGLYRYSSEGGTEIAYRIRYHYEVEGNTKYKIARFGFEQNIPRGLPNCHLTHVKGGVLNFVSMLLIGGDPKTSRGTVTTVQTQS